MNLQITLINMTLSTISSFNDLFGFLSVISQKFSEEEFIIYNNLQAQFCTKWENSIEEHKQVVQKLDQNVVDLETKLFNARRLLELENKLRKNAENERDELEKKIIAARDILYQQRDIHMETKKKLEFLTIAPKKVDKSMEAVAIIENKYGANGINSTGSFLYDLNLTQSEDDFLDERLSPKKLMTNNIFKVNSTSFTISKNDNRNINNLETKEEYHEKQLSYNTEPIYYDIKTPKMKSKNFIKHPTEMLVSPEIISSPILKREHHFVLKSFKKSETCANCNKKFRFGSVWKCKICQICSHQNCKTHLRVPCAPPMFNHCKNESMGYISEYVPKVAPFIPALIVHCVVEIESRGLNEVGIYRISGLEREVKALKEMFLKSQTISDLSSIDIHVLCGCVKDFLRSLKEPLIPQLSWKDFHRAIENIDDADESKFQMLKVIEDLPQANRDTLSFLVLHFQRISECEEVKMPLDNLAKIFGPTIVGFSSPESNQSTIFRELPIQFNIMKSLMSIPMEYWFQFVDVRCFSAEKTLSIHSKSRQTNPLYPLYASPLKGSIRRKKILYGKKL